MPTAIDLFCGAGGFSEGLREAGFKNIFSVEYDHEISKTYKQNFPNHILFETDISDLNEEQIKSTIGKRSIDLIVGGPPCQGFSMAGLPGRTALEDPRNRLFLEFVRIVDIVKPKIFIFENVAAIARHRDGLTKCEIEQAFENIGYSVESRVLDAADYGVPQHRRRFIMVGTRTDLDLHFIFPNKQKHQISVKEAICKYPPLESGEGSNIPNHRAMKHSEDMLNKMSYVKDGGNRMDIPENLRPKTGDARKYIRYDSSKPSVCVTGDMRKIFHYEQNRALTCRELAALQSFPDDFIFVGKSICIQQQIGNAVPPHLAKLLGEKVKDALK